MLLGIAVSVSTQTRGTRVEVVRKDADRRVDILVDGKPFTSYIWPTTLKKPVLFPIRTARARPSRADFPWSRGLASGWTTRTMWGSGSTTAT